MQSNSTWHTTTQTFAVDTVSVPKAEYLALLKSNASPVFTRYDARAKEISNWIEDTDARKAEVDAIVAEHFKNFSSSAYRRYVADKDNYRDYFWANLFGKPKPKIPNFTNAYEYGVYLLEEENKTYKAYGHEVTYTSHSQDERPWFRLVQYYSITRRSLISGNMRLYSMNTCAEIENEWEDEYRELTTAIVTVENGPDAVFNISRETFDRLVRVKGLDNPPQLLKG